MTNVELTAVRVQPEDADPAEALERVQGLEGEAVDDATWDSMVALARMVVGGGPDTEVEEDREWGSAKVVGPTVVDVLWQGNAAYIFYGVGSAPEDQFFSVLRRFRDAGFTIVQGYAVAEGPPSASLAEIVAAQEADIGS